MNSTERYCRFALCREMLETAMIIRDFKLGDVDDVIDAIKETTKVLLTGEGSSRIFPAKNLINIAMKKGSGIIPRTEGAMLASEYDLDDYTVFGASNSGSTKEVIRLLEKLYNNGNKNIFGLTARTDVPLFNCTKTTFTLNCGWEDSVAATKSVLEQAVFYQELFAKLEGESIQSNLTSLADGIDECLAMKIPDEIISAIAYADTVYFVGKNNGVAEELRLKTNEITRKKSDFLEGTYVFHGIEEVIKPNDIVIVIDPYNSEHDKIKDVLNEGVGVNVVTISTEDTAFISIKIPEILDDLQGYLYLVTGWNILVEVGLRLNVDLDKPERARKVGNEYIVTC